MAFVVGVYCLVGVCFFSGKVVLSPAGLVSWWLWCLVSFRVLVFCTGLFFCWLHLALWWFVLLWGFQGSGVPIAIYLAGFFFVVAVLIIVV